MKQKLTSSSNIVKKYRKLTQKKYRKEFKLFVVEGLKTIAEIKDYDMVECIITTDEKFEHPQIKVLYCDEDVMYKLYEQKPVVKYIAICKMIDLKIDEDADLLVLNKISDPGNLGTIIRNAIAFNITNIIIDNESVDIYNSKVLKAMHGANFHANIVYCDCFKYLTEHEYNIVTSFIDKKNNYQFTNDRANALVLGNEAVGIETKYEDIMNSNFKIDINFESLNVASASAIMLYELRRSK